MIMNKKMCQRCVTFIEKQIRLNQGFAIKLNADHCDKLEKLGARNIPCYYYFINELGSLLKLPEYCDVDTGIFIKE